MHSLRTPGVRVLRGCAIAVVLFATPRARSGEPAAQTAPAASATDQTNGTERTALDDYIARPEPKFAWTLVKRQASPQGRSWLVHLVSQEWQGIVWEHDLQVFEPATLQRADKLIIYNTNGKVNPAESLVGPLLANKTGARVAILFGNPNQPLFGGLREDDLIAHTYVQYLASQDPTWPLLFPMTKSIVKAMDAVQQLGRDEQWPALPESYLITGGSKRGWASWLAAVVDPRVYAVAPIVIEIKMRQQMARQLGVLGANTDKLAPYSSRGLTDPAKFDTPEGRRLWKWVDPWMYRERLEMPKLLIKATNDPWWLLDSMNLYWDDLSGPKHCLYFANEVHELPNHRPQAADVVSAFFLRTARGQQLPDMSWKHDDGDGALRVEMRSAEKPIAARMWSTTSPSRDFRQSPWTASDMTWDGEAYRGEVRKPAQGHAALYGELEFADEGLKYTLTTSVRTE